jgi:hypothetical protein
MSHLVRFPQKADIRPLRNWPPPSERELQLTGEIGPGGGCVPGDAGLGTSTSGPAGGVSAGGCVG